MSDRYPNDLDCFPCARWRDGEEFNFGEIVQHGGVVYACAVGNTTYEPAASSAWVRIGLLAHYPTTGARLNAAKRALASSPYMRRRQLAVFSQP